MYLLLLLLNLTTFADIWVSWGHTVLLHSKKAFQATPSPSKLLQDFPSKMASVLPSINYFRPVAQLSDDTYIDYTNRQLDRMQRAPERRRRSNSITTIPKDYYKPVTRQIRESHWEAGIVHLLNNSSTQKITVWGDYRGNKFVVERSKNPDYFLKISYYNNGVADIEYYKLTNWKDLIQFYASLEEPIDPCWWGQPAW